MSNPSPKSQKKEQKNNHHLLIDSSHLLIIFTRNPVLGQCKTRLAKTIGDAAALAIYKILLKHTQNITKNLKVHKQVHYSEELWKNDIWDDHIFEKLVQQGSDLGERMANAFRKGFEAGFDKIIIIGSDIHELEAADIEEAFASLQLNDVVIGPADDGGYYLLGMKKFKASLFKNKTWGKERIFENTMNDLMNENVYLLKSKNDIDIYDDVKNVAAFQPFLKVL